MSITLLVCEMSARTNTQKRRTFHHSGLNAKVSSQEITGVTGKFDPGVQNEAGKRLTVLPRENTDHSKHPLPTTQEKTLHMDITRWSTLKSDRSYSLQPQNGEALYSQQKQDRELTVAQIVNSLLPNSDLN